MAWTYQVEYQLGRRGGRVTRTYQGFRAFLAIAFDLTLGLIFGSVGLVFGSIWWSGWLCVQIVRLSVVAIVETLMASGRIARSVVLLPGRLVRSTPRSLPAKPAWVAFDDL
ncbi:hypothetical protein P12x_005543 [Tundrisphaera lichenicola]|uniref:hypothetical protein n=1 Tax=Tundrisphaera lichenicola TaxID=2029860 RepID=UPI003EBA447A